MAVYGPATGHYSSQSIRAARKTGGKGGSKLKKDASGKWVNTPDSSGYEQDYYGGGNSYQDLIDRSYQQRQKALQESINNAVTKNESNIANVNRAAEDANNSAYVSRELAKAQSPETLSAMGMTGGASESALLGINTNFENSRNTTNQQKQSSLDQIYQNSAEIRNSGNTALADLGANYSQQLASALQQQQAMQMQKEAQDRENQLAIIGASSNDYQAKINNITSDNDPTNDWLIPYYNMARNDKVAGIQQSEQEAADKEFDRWAKEQQIAQGWARANKSGRSAASAASSSSESDGYTNKTDAYNADYVNVLNGNVSPAQIEQERNSIIARYGPEKYKQLLAAASSSFKLPISDPNKVGWSGIGQEYLLPNMYRR